MLAAVICSLSVVGIVSANAWTTYALRLSNDSGGHGVFEVSFKSEENRISSMKIYEKFSPTDPIIPSYYYSKENRVAESYIKDEVDKKKADISEKLTKAFWGIDFIKTDVNVDVNDKDGSYTYSCTIEINDLLNIYNYNRFKECVDDTGIFISEDYSEMDMDDVMDDAYMTAYKLESELISNGYKKQ